MSKRKKSDLSAIKDRIHMIIAAIDSLKGRKARPDETKICNFVERRFRVDRQQTVTAIEEAVREGTILKVKYKDSVSYRNPANFSSKMQNHVVSIDGKCTPQTLNRILRELRSLSRFSCDGVSQQSIIDSLRDNSQYVNYNESIVSKVLEHAIESGSVKQLTNGNYMLSFGKRVFPRKGGPQQTHQLLNDNSLQSSLDNSCENQCEENVMINEKIDETNDTSNKSDDIELNEESSTVSNSTSGSVSVTRKKSNQVMKRERPVSKRKKFKKSLGPDFIESSELGLQYMRDSFEPKCDICHIRTKFDRRGEKEELLSCKDCSAKAHPSCMDYSEELAKRSSSSPWQCMECKTCALCQDSRDGIHMLVCDLCDKGYHMNCHIPTVKEKPSGKWVCTVCSSGKNGDKKVDSNELSVENTNEELEPKKEPNVIKDTNNEMSVIDENQQLETVSLSSSTSNTKENLLNGYPEVVPNPLKWSAEEVEAFIRNIGFPEQSHLFKEQEIDGTSLMLLRRTDVLTGFEMKLGPALKIYSHVMRLQKHK